MSGQVWVPGAQRVAGPNAAGGSMAGGPPRVTHHITWDALDNKGRQPSFDAVRNYLVSAGFEPTLMVCPFTGRIAQFLPADRSAFALQNKSGGAQTNRQGSVNVQVEWFFTPGCVVNGNKYAALTDTPMRGLAEVMALARSWGIPDVWPLGVPDWRSRRDANVWTQQAGHYGHSQVPENSHTDPGPLHLLAPATPTTSEDDVMASLEEVRAVVRDEVNRLAGGPRVRGKDGQVVDGDPATISIADAYTLVEESERRTGERIVASEARILAAIQAKP